jgi:hypothetical protein
VRRIAAYAAVSVGVVLSLGTSNYELVGGPRTTGEFNGEPLSVPEGGRVTLPLEVVAECSGTVSMVSASLRVRTVWMAGADPVETGDADTGGEDTAGDTGGLELGSASIAPCDAGGVDVCTLALRSGEAEWLDRDDLFEGCADAEACSASLVLTFEGASASTFKWRASATANLDPDDCTLTVTSE